MDQKWIRVVLILLVCHDLTAGEVAEIKPAEGQQVNIQCEPEVGTLVFWFRVLDKSGMEFIASFSNNGMIKVQGKDYSRLFSHSKISQRTLTLTSYRKGVDSGIYSCGSLYKGTELKFGKVTRLADETPELPKNSHPAPATTPSVVVTTTPCVCKDKKGPSNPSLFCDPLVLGSLAGGCGLLLLLLIVTILYCNRIRTRRCPHHYKRRLQAAPEKQMMTNRCG